MADQMSGFRPQKAYITNEDPLYGFAADGSTDDTAKFTAMRAEVAFAAMDVDLKGKTYFVTAVPAGKFHNGFFKLTNLDNSAPVMLPAPRTLDRRILRLDGGRIMLGWPQDTMSAYNGVGYLGYMPSFTHSAGSRQFRIGISTDEFASLSRERVETFNFTPTDDIEVFGACVVPPTSTSVGAYHIAVAQDITMGVSQLCYRALAEYKQTTVSGALAQEEGPWRDAVVDGATFGEALRSAVDTAYSVTTSGLPVEVHSITCVGGSAGVSGDIVAGFASMTGMSVGPHLVYVTGSPKDGACTISAVGRIGLLTEGTEPSVAWYRSSSANRLCGFIRHQGSSYPLRFYAASALTQAGIEAATIQDCPWGNDFATTSPIPCRMRPRRKGTTSGWIATSETLDGSSTDELHFVMTGRRMRDGGPGPVGLYWGRVTRGSGEFADIWTRCTLVKVKDLYFSNSNLTDTSNNVGVPSMCFTDANTLHIAYNTMMPAIGGDYDAAVIEVMTIYLDDAYADAPRNWDDGDKSPVMVQRTIDYIPPGEPAAISQLVEPNLFQRNHVTGNAWISSTSAADNAWGNICYAKELGLLVAVAESGTGNRVMTSPDGVNWTARTTPADNSWRGLCWSPEIGLLVAVAFSGTGNRVMTSPDGINWTTRTSPADNNWDSVCWSKELGLFVAVCTTGTGKVMTSTNGIDWILRGGGNANWTSVCWSPDRWLFVAVAQSGTGTRVMTSPNGIVWTWRNTPADNDWRSVCWAAELGLFVAVAQSGTGTRVMTSPDGYNWTIRTSAADNNWLGVSWSPELGLLAAVSTTGSGDRVMTSPDGITWTLRTSAADNNWNGVCWANDLGLFAAISSTGTGNRVMTSKSAFSVSYR